MCSVKHIGNGDSIVEFTDGGRYVTNLDDRLYCMPIKYKNGNLTKKEWCVEFAKRLNWILKRDDVTAVWLADQLGITQAMMSRYMRGSTCPSAYIVDQIADILKIKIDDLLLVPHYLKSIDNNEKFDLVISETTYGGKIGPDGKII